MLHRFAVRNDIGKILLKQKVIGHLRFKPFLNKVKILNLNQYSLFIFVSSSNYYKMLFLLQKQMDRNNAILAYDQQRRTLR